GGSSAGSRDAKMRDLIEEHIAEASTRRTATMIAEAAEAAPAPTPPTRSLRPAHAATAAAAAAAPTAARPALSPVASGAAPPANPAVQGAAMLKNRPGSVGSSDPIKPIAVKTVKVKLAPTHTATLAPAAPMIPIDEDTSVTAPAPAAA